MQYTSYIYVKECIRHCWFRKIWAQVRCTHEAAHTHAILLRPWYVFYFCAFRNEAIHSSLLTDKDLVVHGNRSPLMKRCTLLSVPWSNKAFWDWNQAPTHIQQGFHKFTRVSARKISNRMRPKATVRTFTYNAWLTFFLLSLYKYRTT